MKARITKSIATASLLLALVGCGGGGNAQPAEAEKPKLPIPPDSILAKVKVGMQENEVIGTIGPATTTDGPYQTGKAWIPYHYGGDNLRKCAHYKGVGRITYSSNSAFSSGFGVMEDGIEYDPSEPGFTKSSQ